MVGGANATGSDLIPRDLGELLAWVTDERGARDYLARVRWPEGFRCPACDAAGAWQTTDGDFLCRACRRRTSVTARTMFHRSHVPLDRWLVACWLCVAQPEVLTARELERQLELANYETAWSMLQRLRHVMQEPVRARLHGEIEVGVAAIGARERPGGPTRRNGEAIVLGAVERRTRPGRPRALRLRAVPFLSVRQVNDFVEGTVAPGARAVFDPSSGPPIARGREALVVEPGATRVIGRVLAELGRSIREVLHAAVSHEHLAYYLDEFAFRSTWYDPVAPGRAFLELLRRALCSEPIALATLTGGSADGYVD